MRGKATAQRNGQVACIVACSRPVAVAALRERDETHTTVDRGVCENTRSGQERKDADAFRRKALVHVSHRVHRDIFWQ
jgi:hypothetical protein